MEALASPQQRNSYDCGMLACMYAHSLAHREKITGFDQTNIPHLRQRMALELLSASSNTKLQLQTLAQSALARIEVSLTVSIFLFYEYN